MPRSRLVVALCLWAWAGAAYGGDTDWRAQYHEGSRRFDAGEYRGALDAFKRAWAVHEDANILFDIAECQRLLGDKTEAVHAYRGYLRRKPDAPNRASIEALIAALEASPPATAPPATAPATPPASAAKPETPMPATLPMTSPAPAAATAAPPATPALPSPPAHGSVYDPWHPGATAPSTVAATMAAPGPQSMPAPPAPAAESATAAPPAATSPPPATAPPAWVAAQPPPERPHRSKAWIAAIVVPSVAVLAVVIGVSAWYASPAPTFTKLGAIQ